MSVDTDSDVDVAGPGVDEPDVPALRPPGPRPAQSAAAALGLVALLVSALVGGNLFGLRDRTVGAGGPESRPPASGRAVPSGAAAPVDAPAAEPRAEPEATRIRSQPWWQMVTNLDGSESTDADSFTIDDGALQWRVRWSCDEGGLIIDDGSGGDPIVEADCPGSGEGYGLDTGPVTLAVEADGPWELEVEQQLDVPLVEAPTAAMTDPATTTAITGTFYRMDQSGTGALTFYRLADGSHVLRLDDFFVSPNVDLEIRLSTLAEPRTTEEYMSAPSVGVAPLDITAGSMNFVVPPDVDPTEFASVVIWCPLIDSAYAAATLEPAA